MSPGRALEVVTEGDETRNVGYERTYLTVSYTGVRDRVGRYWSALG